MCYTYIRIHLGVKIHFKKKKKTLKIQRILKSVYPQETGENSTLRFHSKSTEGHPTYLFIYNLLMEKHYCLNVNNSLQVYNGKRRFRVDDEHHPHVCIILLFIYFIILYH